MIPLFREIIMDNRKNDQGTDLTCSGQLNYMLTCGPEFKYVMKYKGGSPFVILNKEPQEAPDQPQGWEFRILGAISDFANYLRNSYKSKYC